MSGRVTMLGISRWAGKGLVSRSFRHPQYAAPRVPTVQGLQKLSDLGGEKLKTPTGVQDGVALKKIRVVGR